MQRVNFQLRKRELLKAALCPAKGNDLSAANGEELEPEPLTDVYGACLDKQNCSAV